MEKKLAIMGTNRFMLGFRLVGITDCFLIDKNNPDETLNEVLNNKEIGLIIMEEKSLDLYDEIKKEKIGNSISPVFLTISEQNSNEEMRNLVKKSIGVDLWSKE